MLICFCCNRMFYYTIILRNGQFLFNNTKFRKETTQGMDSSWFSLDHSPAASVMDDYFEGWTIRLRWVLSSGAQEDPPCPPPHGNCRSHFLLAVEGQLLMEDLRPKSGSVWRGISFRHLLGLECSWWIGLDRGRFMVRNKLHTLSLATV